MNNAIITRPHADLGARKLEIPKGVPKQSYEFLMFKMANLSPVS